MQTASERTYGPLTDQAEQDQRRSHRLHTEGSRGTAGLGNAPEPIRFSWLLEGVTKGTGVRAQDLLDN